MNRASGDDVGVAGAFPSQAYVASPFNFPQMISTLLPSLVASTSFPYATFFPTFLPFASIAMQPVFFNVTNVAGCSDDYRRDDILAVDAIMERSASTEESGLHDTSSSLLLGRRQKRVSPYRSADSASRVSLESCSGTGTTILNLPSAASSSALSSERILKRNCAWPDTQGSTNLGHAADVDMLTPEAESAIDAMSQASHASPFNTTAGLLATLPCTQTQLQPGFTGRPRSSPAQQQRGPTQALALVWEPCLGSHDRAAVTPQSVGLHGGGTALAPESTVAVPDDVGLDVDAQRRAGLNAHQQLPLRSSSGSLIWVGARRYGAILRRRRQREAQRSGLRVVSHACQQKHVKRPSLQATELEQIRAWDLLQCGNHDDCSDDIDDMGAHGSLSVAAVNAKVAMPATTRVDALTVWQAVPCVFPPPCTAWLHMAPTDVTPVLGADAALKEVTESQTALGWVPTAVVLEDAVRTAWEAELQAVLAEDTGVLTLVDDDDESTAAEDDS